MGGVRNAGPAGQTLDLNFMFPGSLDPRITFTRASPASYQDASGVIQTAAVDQPRWDYAGGVLRGLLIEAANGPNAIENVVISSANMSPWFSTSGGTWFVEFISTSPLAASSYRRIVTVDAAAGIAPMTLDNTVSLLGQYDAGSLFTTNAVTVGAVSKGVTTWTANTAKACLNGGTIVTAPFFTGYGALASSGTRFLTNATPAEGMNGYLRRVLYWPRVLSDTEMQQVTM